MYALGKLVPVPFFACCAHYSWFVTLIIAGIILYEVRHKEISRRLGAAFLAANYLLTILGLYLYDKRYLSGEPYLVSFVYAMFVFLMLPKLELKENKVISFLADISFSVYLLHMDIGGLVMSLFENRIRYTFAVCISLAAVLLCSTAFCYFVEKPIRHLVRRL